MSGRYSNGQHEFAYSELIVCRIVRAYPPGLLPIDPAQPRDKRPYCDISALDGRGNWQQVPVMIDPARVRNYRRGQVVIVGFRYTYSNDPIILGHFYNQESAKNLEDSAGAAVSDLVPPPYAFLDDDVLYHFETNAFFRFRNATATALSGGRIPNGTPNGMPAPGIAEITMNTGATIVMTEDGTGQCSASISMPSGAYLTIDLTGNIFMNTPGTFNVTATGDINITGDSDATVNITGNATTTVGGNLSATVDGTTTVTSTGAVDVSTQSTATVTAMSDMLLQSSTKIKIEAGDVELGADTSEDPTKKVARKADTDAISTKLNAFIADYNNHEHGGITSGSGNTAKTNITEGTFTAPSCSPQVYAE